VPSVIESAVILFNGITFYLSPFYSYLGDCIIYCLSYLS